MLLEAYSHFSCEAMVFEQTNTLKNKYCNKYVSGYEGLNNNIEVKQPNSLCSI